MLKFDKQFKNKSAHSNEGVQNTIKILKDEMDTETVGYYKLPSLSKEIIKTLEQQDFSKISQVVVIGIGGSSLGIKAIEQILRPYSKTAKEMIFLENSDPVSISQNLNKVQKENACFFVISKSGSTIETTSIFKTLIKFCDIDLHLKADQQRVYAITDAGSVLSDFAKANTLQEFNIPENVGGRFSVLSAVGVAPLYIAGYDMTKVLQGAGAFEKRFFRAEENHLIEKASYLVQNAAHSPINVLFSYADRLENFTKWFVQLWAESLGKVDKKGQHVGLTPIGLIGAVDQHSFLQLIIEGPRDKCVTFIKIDDFKADLSIPDITLEGIEKTNFINNKKFNLLINAQCDATMQSLTDTGVDTDIITLDCVTPENIGALIMYFELLTSVVGIKLDINTYDQPGVELGKQILYKNLQNN